MLDLELKSLAHRTGARSMIIMSSGLMSQYVSRCVRHLGPSASFVANAVSKAGSIIGFV